MRGEASGPVLAEAGVFEVEDPLDPAPGSVGDHVRLEQPGQLGRLDVQDLPP
jgi:hypothetical protein